MALTLQKANFWKRISAWLLDFILLAVLSVGGMALTGVIFNYDAHAAELTAYQKEYEDAYGVDFEITQDDFAKLTQEQKDKYNDVLGEFSKDERVIKTHNTLFYMTIAMMSVGLFIGVLVVEFIVPLFLRNGQTVGKKVFGLAVMRTTCVRLTDQVLFIRALFGKYIIETMFPAVLLLMIYYGAIDIVGTITIILLLILQIGVLIATQTNSAIHDLLTDTVVVDMASQQIFDTEEDLLAYKQEQHAQEVARKEY